MIGSFITRGLVMVFGYAYPAYECFKTVEMNKPDIQELRFWCQYWILVAALTLFERIGDAFVSWVPMYSEAKLAFFIYLWCPKTKGTTYVYDSFFKPLILRHETEIDRNLLELRTRAEDMLFLYWEKAASYASTRVFDVLQYIASQSTPPRPAQPQQSRGRERQPAITPNRQSAASSQVQAEEPPSPASSASSSENQGDSGNDAETKEASSPAPPIPSVNVQKATPSVVETAKAAEISEAEMMQVEVLPSTSEIVKTMQEEVIVEEPGRITRARSRKSRSVPPR